MSTTIEEDILYFSQYMSRREESFGIRPNDKVDVQP